jgi:hypothetical protein
VGVTKAMTEYSKGEEKNFGVWLSEKLPHIRVKLNIPKSKAVSKAILKEVKGFDELLPLYDWKSKWHSQFETSESSDWPSTKKSINQLRNLLSVTLKEGNSEQLKKVCLSVLEWGGDRNAAVGATSFLNEIGDDLSNYIKQTTQAFCLDVEDNNLSCVKKMNSMMTKIHAFFSVDGLPIYDSRVSAAVASFAEMYRRETKQSTLHETLMFPLVGGSIKPGRTVRALFPDASQTVLRYSDREIVPKWSKAKKVLGRVMQHALEKNSLIFPHEKSKLEKMRALEACFFMVGYDVSSIRIHAE